MIDNLIEFCFKIISLLINGYKKYKEAIFVTKRQYRLRFLHYYIAKNNQAIAVIQVIIKRIKVKFSLQYLASNKYLLQDIHPVDASRISFITNFDNNNCFDQLPDYIKSRNYACPIIKQIPTIKIQSQYFSKENKETLFVLSPTYSSTEITVSATELIKKHDLIYSLGSLNALTVGYAASEDELRNINSDTATDKKLNSKKTNPENSFNYYHILCVILCGAINFRYKHCKAYVSTPYSRNGLNRALWSRRYIFSINFFHSRYYNRSIWIRSKPTNGLVGTFNDYLLYLIYPNCSAFTFRHRGTL